MQAADVAAEHAEDPVGLPARRAALALLTAALARRTGFEEAASTAAFGALEPRERAFARALALTALRWRGSLDAALAARLRQPPPEVVVNILRLGAAQLLHMQAAAHAAVDLSVELAEAEPAARRFKGLVNAVLRGLLREPPAAPEPAVHAPPWLYARWAAAYGAEAAAAIAGTIPQEPATDLTVRDGAAGAALAEALEGEVLHVGAGGDATVRTGRRGDVTGWPGWETGGWWVQDASAAVPARLLHVGAGETALDLCAAPGGKTLQLVAAGAAVTALDRSAARLLRLEQNLARTGLTAACIAADAATWTGGEGEGRRFDAVLLDAPCSATGTFRRHPEVLWATTPTDVARLAAAQARLLDAAVARTRPGGRLVYCVCSLEPEEGEAQVEAALARHADLRLDPISAGEGGAPAASLRPDGTLRMLPHHRGGGADGFYAARMVRAG